MSSLYFIALVFLAFLALVITFFFVAKIHHAKTSERNPRPPLDLDIDNEPVNAWRYTFKNHIPLIDPFIKWSREQEIKLESTLPGYRRPIGMPIGFLLSLISAACYFSTYYPAFIPGAILGWFGASYNIQGLIGSLPQKSIPGILLNPLGAFIGLTLLFLNLRQLFTQFPTFMSGL